MGKIYSPPVEAGELPRLDSRKESWQTYVQREQEYVAKVQKWAKENGSGSLAGELVTFPYADGYAQYVVFSLKPVSLIHLPVGDAWQYPYVNRLTAADIKKEVGRIKGMKKLFASK